MFAGFLKGDPRQAGLDAILRPAMCACILHNILIDHPVPPDWFNESMAELEQDDELNHSVEQSSADTIGNQVFAYMLEEH